MNPDTECLLTGKPFRRCCGDDLMLRRDLGARQPQWKVVQKATGGTEQPQEGGGL